MNNESQGYYLILHYNNMINFNVRSRFIKADKDLALGAVIHIACVFKVGETCQLCINGVFKGENANRTNIPMRVDMPNIAVDGRGPSKWKSCA
ncbi:hypothetical protein BCY86_01225 [Pajaroellobacter abortibovis]|uniref:Uncharacterized protein n=1 Tax=Pajaroellobacter abortibovis TaxID=1882918 RepID=A0A1L6MVB2_9BACT|nr:hypothetical protein BCY86_01225 [Pajaroellobacter abortibovis]